MLVMVLSIIVSFRPRTRLRRGSDAAMEADRISNTIQKPQNFAGQRWVIYGNV